MGVYRYTVNMNSIEKFREILEAVYEDDIHPKENLIIINKFLRRVAYKVKDRTLGTNYATLIIFSRWCKIPFNELTEDDILDFLGELKKHTFKRGAEDKKYSPHTIHMHKIIVKKFLTWYEDIPEKEKMKIIEILKEKTPESTHENKKRKNLLTANEVETLIEACQNSRDRAMIAILYESGCRRGELLSCRIQDVEFTSFGVNLTFPSGKTGARSVPLVYASSFISQWLSDHPQKDNPNACLIISHNCKDGQYKQLCEEGVYVELKKIAERTNIKKPIYPHGMRHARASVLAEHMTDQQMKQFLGWTKNSSMASVYVHDVNVQNSVLKMYGIEAENEEQDNLEVVRCERCREINPIKMSHCCKCFYPLTEKAKAIEKAEEEARWHDMQMHNAEVVEQLVNERMAAFKKELFGSVFAEEEKKEEDW